MAVVARQGLRSKYRYGNDTVESKAGLAPDPGAASDRAVWG